MTDLTDEQLAAKAAGGDDAALDLLAARYFKLVGYRAAAFMPTLSELEREDLGQEGFIGLIGAVKSYNEQTGVPFRAFAVMCIDRSIYSAVRASFRKKRVPEGMKRALDETVQAVDSGADPEAAVIAREEYRRLRERIDSALSELERRILFMHLQGASYKDIAAKEGCTTKAVDNALQRVRRKLSSNR